MVFSNETEVRTMSKSICEPLPILRCTLGGHRYSVCLELICYWKEKDYSVERGFQRTVVSLLASVEVLVCVE